MLAVYAYLKRRLYNVLSPNRITVASGHEDENHMTHGRSDNKKESDTDGKCFTNATNKSQRKNLNKELVVIEMDDQKPNQMETMIDIMSEIENRMNAKLEKRLNEFRSKFLSK